MLKSVGLRRSCRRHEPAADRNNSTQQREQDQIPHGLTPYLRKTFSGGNVLEKPPGPTKSVLALASTRCGRRYSADCKGFEAVCKPRQAKKIGVDVRRRNKKGREHLLAATVYELDE